MALGALFDPLLNVDRSVTYEELGLGWLFGFMKLDVVDVEGVGLTLSPLVVVWDFSSSASRRSRYSSVSKSGDSGSMRQILTV